MKHEIAVQLGWTLAAIFSVAAGFIAWAFRGERSRRIWVTYWLELVILAAVFVPAYLGGAWLVGAVAALTVVSVGELRRTLAAGGERPLPALDVSLCLALVALAAWRPEALPWAAAGSLLLIGAAASASSRRDDLAGRLRCTLSSVVYPGLGLAHVVALGGMDGGFGYIVLCYGLVEINDSAAFLIGSSLGRRRIFPALSPNKTLEGSLGGLVATLLMALVLRFAVPDLSLGELMVGACVLALAGQGGDLYASRIKRRSGVKDFGDSVPTHGGLLDVYDSFLFVAPLFYYFALAC